MSKHTPGPWHVSASYSDTCDWEVVSETDVIAGEYGIESADDARLIAAAPDLLEARSPSERSRRSGKRN